MYLYTVYVYVYVYIYIYREREGCAFIVVAFEVSPILAACYDPAKANSPPNRKCN